MENIYDLNALEQLYLHRQSCRAFDREKPIDEALLERACNVALLAPSACNAQPWKLYCVTGKKKDELVKCLQGMGMNKFASDAAALIVVTEEKGSIISTLGGKLTKNEFAKNDVGILTAHLVLALQAAGLSSCIIGWCNQEKICELLSLAKDTVIPEVVAVGYAKEGYEIRQKKRKKSDDVLKIIKD